MFYRYMYYILKIDIKTYLYNIKYDDYIYFKRNN